MPVAFRCVVGQFCAFRLKELLAKLGSSEGLGGKTPRVKSRGPREDPEIPPEVFITCSRTLPWESLLVTFTCLSQTGEGSSKDSPIKVSSESQVDGKT